MSPRTIAAGLLILAAWGCQSTPAPDAPATAPAAAPATPDDLQAVAALLDDGRIGEAAAALDAIDPTRLLPAQADRFLLLSAELALARGDLTSARALLGALDDSALDDPLAAAVLRARLLAAEGEHVAAAERLMSLTVGATPADDAAAQRLSDAVWGQLGRVPAMETLARTDSATGVFRGWWLLKSEMLQSFTLAEQRRRLQRWQEGWAQHPAARHLPGDLAALAAGETATGVAHVGLMLPLSGPLSRAGRAVRDGFIATYLSRRDDVSFEISVYDTAAESIGASYERALLAGADLLVGPLSKDDVAALNGLNPELPVLALNYLGDDELPAPNLVQLGLTIEDEAATLARWLRDAGAERLLLFHNEEEWSMRARQALESDWQGPLDAQVLQDLRTVTESVGVAMHVAASEQRRDELEELLRQDLEFLPRARSDVDAIVALVSPLEANALVPALRFHFATSPVYATSQTVRGVPASGLADLEGFHVSELPWFVLQDASYHNLDDAFELDGNAFAALYALGVDAFRLAERVPMILGGRLNELLGSTGELTFSAGGRIDRRLARTVVSDRRLRYAAGAYGR